MPSSGPATVVYWDSCVFLSLLSKDPDRVGSIAAMLDEAGDGQWEIVTSTYTVAEVAFVAAERDAHALDMAVQSEIDKLWRPASPVKLVDFHLGIAERARDFVRHGVVSNMSIKPPDAIHLASAVEMGAAALHTYNLDHFERWSAYLGITIANPAPHLHQLDF